MATKRTTTTAATAKAAAPGKVAALAAMLEADVAAPREPTADQLQRITYAAQQVQLKQARLTLLEEQVEAVQKELTALQEVTLPALLDEAGVAELVLATGERVLKDLQLYASISKDNAPAACEWLRKNKYAALVKAALSVPVEKGDTKTLKAVQAALRKLRVPYELQEGVHPQTLKAFVRESLEQGRALPPSITYHQRPVVQVKVPKATARRAQRPADF